MSLLLSWGRHARLTVVVANKIVPIPSWNLGRNSEFLTCPLYASARTYGLLSSRASAHGPRGCARWVFAVGLAFNLGLRDLGGPWTFLQTWLSDWAHASPGMSVKLSSASQTHILGIPCTKIGKKVNIVLFYRNWTHCLMIDELTDMIFMKQINLFSDKFP